MLSSGILLTGALLSSTPLFAAPIIDTIAPNSITITWPAGYSDPNTYYANNAIVTPDFETEVADKLEVQDDVTDLADDFIFTF